MTLETNFRLPIMREFLLLHGVVDASKTACLIVLGKGSGQAILLAVGGAQEALLAQPGTYDLVRRVLVTHQLLCARTSDEVELACMHQYDLALMGRCRGASLLGTAPDSTCTAVPMAVVAVCRMGVIHAVGRTNCNCRLGPHSLLHTKLLHFCTRAPRCWPSARALCALPCRQAPSWCL